MQYCEPHTLAAAEDRLSHEINAAKLLAVEKLLWGHKPRKPGEGMQGHQLSDLNLLLNTSSFVALKSLYTYRNPMHKPGKLLAVHAGVGCRVRAKVAHRLLVLVTQYISFEAADIQVVYKQSGMPGPKPAPGSPLEGMDALCLEVRKIGLQSQGELVTF